MAEVHVIDDEPMLCMLIAYVLRRLGHVAYTYRAPADFFSKTHDTRPDLVIADFIMPQLDGFEFCRRLRAIDDMKSVPVMFTTGLELDPALVGALREVFGVVGVLPKPFTAESLISVSDRALNTPFEVAPITDQSADALREKVASAVRSVGQRLQPRISARFPLHYSTGGEFISAVAINVTVGGLLVIADQAPDVYSPVTIRLAGTGAKAGLELAGTIAHVAARPDGTFGFGVALRENNVQRFYGWYEFVARTVSASSRKHSDNEILVLGFDPCRISPLERLIGLFCMVELSLVPVSSWQAAIARVATPGHNVKLLMVDTRGKGDAEKAEFDVARMQQYQEQDGGRIALLGVTPDQLALLPTELNLDCLYAPTMRELVEAIGRWLTLPLRATARVPLAVGAELHFPDGSTRACHIGDIGTAGLKLVCTEALSTATTLKVRFSLPGFPEPFMAEVSLRWMRSDGAGRFVCGVAFEQVAAETVAAIDGYIMTQWLA